jgi:hypothetical protein
VHHFGAEPISDYGNLQFSAELYIPEDSFYEYFFGIKREEKNKC